MLAVADMKLSRSGESGCAGAARMRDSDMLGEEGVEFERRDTTCPLTNDIIPLSKHQEAGGNLEKYIKPGL
jgi:hypothetical protein